MDLPTDNCDPNRKYGCPQVCVFLETSVRYPLGPSGTEAEGETNEGGEEEQGGGGGGGGEEGEEGGEGGGGE